MARDTTVSQVGSEIDERVAPFARQWSMGSQCDRTDATLLFARQRAPQRDECRAPRSRAEPSVQRVRFTRSPLLAGDPLNHLLPVIHCFMQKIVLLRHILPGRPMSHGQG